MDDAQLGEIVRQRAGERPDMDIAPVVIGLDRLDLDLQHLPGLGAGDRDRAGADVARQYLALGAGVDRGERRRHDERRCGHHVGGTGDG
jgi:hypothetical protein